MGYYAPVQLLAVIDDDEMPRRLALAVVFMTRFSAHEQRTPNESSVDVTLAWKAKEP